MSPITLPGSDGVVIECLRPPDLYVFPYPHRRRIDASADVDAIRLLIVDDEPGYCAYLAAVARRLGFVVETVADGELALARLEQGPFDLAVIDLEMPRLSGIDLIVRLRAADATKGLYALMLTAREDMASKLAALEAGFDDFVIKSAPEPELVAKLVAASRVAARQRTLDSTIRELYGLATRDELTGVFNRRFFVAETTRMLAQGMSVSVVLFDLDDFKEVNDTFGHLAGDHVLRDLGVLFQKSTRPEDLVARYGGDEFVMAVANLSLPQVQKLAERLTGAVRAMQWRAGEVPFGIGVTTGLACAALLPVPQLEPLLEAADRDLYKNKWLQAHPQAQPGSFDYPAAARGGDVVLTVRTQIESPDPAEPHHNGSAADSGRGEARER